MIQKKFSPFFWKLTIFLLTSLLVIPVGALLWWLDCLVLAGGVSAFSQEPFPVLRYILIIFPEKIVSPIFFVIFPENSTRGLVKALALGTFYCYMGLSISYCVWCIVRLRVVVPLRQEKSAGKEENDVRSDH